MKDEASYLCDSCGEEIVVPIDLSAGIDARSTSRIARSAAARTSFTSRSMRMATCGYGRKGSRMLPLYEDPWFTFRFADDRIIPRFHLEGVEAGRRVSVFKIDPGTGERLGLLATATVGEGGWVEPGRADHREGRGCVHRRAGTNCGAVIGGLFWFRRQPETEVDKPR